MRKVAEPFKEGTILVSGFGTRGKAPYEGSSHRKLEEMLKRGRQWVRYVLCCLGGSFCHLPPPHPVFGGLVLGTQEVNLISFPSLTPLA